MAEFFGDIERALADLYVYRWPISFGILLLVTGVTVWGYRKGWHMVIWKHRLAVSIVGTPALAALLIAGWYFGSPLFTSKTVNEEFPFAFNAAVPSNMTRTAVEQTMAGMAEVDQRVFEAMPVSMPLAPTTEETPDTTRAQSAAVKVKSGNFQDADSFHRGSGQAIIFRGADGSNVLRLENLSVTNGPDLHVFLSPHQSPDSRSDVKLPGYVDLGKLKGNKGNQNYPIPDDVDIGAQMSVVIYCVPFSVIFSVATLEGQEYPFAVNAEVPSGMTRAKVEQVMGGMAKVEQEVMEDMSEAMPMEKTDDPLMKGGMAMMDGAMAMVEAGMDKPDTVTMDKGVAMMEEAMAVMEESIEESDESVIVEAQAMVEEAIEVSDEAMITKGLDMMAEGMEAMAEVPAAQAGPVKLKSGNFRDADSFHRGSGQATIYRGPDGSRLLRLENLSVTNGPQLHVILSPHQNPESRGDVKQQGYVDLGRLKGNKGNQNYPIPDDVDVDAQMSVTIYCVPFSVIFSVAMLQAQS